MAVNRERFENNARYEFARIAKCTGVAGISAQFIKGTMYGVFDDELTARRVYMEYTLGGNHNNKFRFFAKGNGQYVVAIDDIKTEVEE